MSEKTTNEKMKKKIKELEDELTLHKLELHALRFSNEKYKDLFENANDAIFIVDSNLQYTEVNKKAVELFGFSKEEFLNMKITDLIPPEQIPRSNDAFHKLHKNDGYEKFEGKLRTKNGRWLEIEVSSSAITHNGEHLGSRDIVRDITQRKQIEFELDKYRTHLEDLVDERTAEILRYASQLEQEIAEKKLAEKERNKLQDQLQQKQKIEAIGAMAGGIAHDFNNTLNAILSYTELAMSNLSPEDNTYSHLEKVVHSVKLASELVKQILTFSSRKKNETRRPVQLQLLVKEELKLLRGTLPENISIRSDICPQCRPILADFIQIHQVILNICTNAINAMSANGGSLTVSLKEVEKPSEKIEKKTDLNLQRYAQLVFDDTGKGMDKTTLKHIFEPYFTTKESGTGLGLATVHSIVKSHGGACIVESSPETGTEFTVCFPIADQPAQFLSHLPGSKKEAIETGTILFVDDEQIIVDAAKIAMKQFGHNIEPFTNAYKAFKAFQANPDKFDIVVTDHKMPGLKGAELAKKILAIKPDIPIVLATGYSETVNEEIAKKMGIKKFVMKPLSMAELSRIISNLLKEKRV